ncbi:26S proteasome non-ATPase regulatory subunit 10-like [Halyomorpha halys]|uniref:26S proteasome non-ATPase regulatory subunit 10-like n=1 Tax=Halyomorpha halys TaxID=286706 RepID=UPI0034D152BC
MAVLVPVAAVDKKDDCQWTALQLAVREGQSSVIKTLLDAGAALDTEGVDEWTPLFNAAMKGQKAVVASLLDHGADPEAKESVGSTPLKDREADMNARNADGLQHCWKHLSGATWPWCEGSSTAGPI